MNVADLQDDDYDEYDDYGDTYEQPADLGGYSQQPSIPSSDPYGYSQPTSSQPEPAASYLPETLPEQAYPPSQTSYSQPDPTPSQPSYSPPADIGYGGGGSSYGGAGGGLNTMSSLGSSLPASSPPAASKYGGGDKCPRCGKTVYFAEAKEGPNNIKYHR
jgi:hypothetical protein